MFSLLSTNGYFDWSVFSRGNKAESELSIIRERGTYKLLLPSLNLPKPALMNSPIWYI